MEETPVNLHDLTRNELRLLFARWGLAPVHADTVWNRLYLGLAPEGTRRRVSTWKSGFHRVAFLADVPIVTLAFALACDRFVFDNEDINGGLQRAIVDVPKLIDQTRAVKFTLLGFLTAGDGQQPNPMTTVFCIGVAVVLCYLIANLRRSNTGRQMLAVRTNERAAAAAGVNVAGTKSLAFAISACVAGVAGAVIAYRSGQANQEKFSYEQSMLFFAFAYLGGISRVSGAVVGGLLVSGGLVF
ncbi:MAG: hypothetical protein RLZZ221_918, partial [Verrucomicrobiota bacterium]